MKKKILIFAGIILLIALVAFLYYAISPLFRTVTVFEDVPTLSENAERKSAPLVDTPAHPASGTVHIIEDDDQTIVRYENLETINGPDLFVYLSTDLEATDFVDLGRLKATVGDVNYEVPEGVNIEEYPYVLIWCRQFGVLFNYANFSEL